MEGELSDPLGSYPDRDEFQIGRMLVWVYYLDGAERELRLSEANAIFSTLLVDIPNVELVARAAVGSGICLELMGISIKPDNQAIYAYMYDDEENFISVTRTADGRLLLL